MNIQTLITMFLDSRCEGKWNETRESYRAKLGKLSQFLNGRDITQETINDFRSYLIGGKKRDGNTLSVFTIRTTLATVKNFLRWGCQAGYLPPITLANVKEPPAAPKAITEDTVNRIIKAAGAAGAEWERIRNLAIIYTLRDSGCRVGVITKLEIGNIDLHRGLGIAADKGGKLTTIFFSQPTRAALAAWLKYRSVIHPADNLLFTGAKKTGLTRGGIHKVLSRLAAAAGCGGDRHNPHSFRHAFARDYITAGGDLSQVSQALGHSSITVTAKYYARWNIREIKRLHSRYSPGNKLPIPTG